MGGGGYFRGGKVLLLFSEYDGKKGKTSGSTEEDKESGSKHSEVKHRKGGASAGKQRYKKGKS